MKKYLFLGLLMFLLTACGSQKVVENAKEYEDLAENLILAINVQDYTKLKENSTEEVNNLLTEEVLSQMTQDITSKGTFKEFGSSKVVMQEDKDKVKKYFVVVKEAKYEDGKLVYTITFDENYKLGGIYYK